MATRTVYVQSWLVAMLSVLPCVFSYKVPFTFNKMMVVMERATVQETIVESSTE